MTTEIAVIGAGLGGLTVAGLLQRAGLTVKIYEQATAFSRIGAGIHLTANVMMVMRRLGIEQALADVGMHPDAFVSRAWDSGEVLFELPLDAASEAHYGGAYINVHRGDLHHILNSALAPGTVAFGRKLNSIDETADRVYLSFEDGSAASADLVIGGDGLNSVVRTQLFGHEPPLYSGKIAHRAIFPTSLLNGLPIRACTKWWGPNSHILVYYMTQTREEVYVVSAAPDPTWPGGLNYLPCDLEEFHAAFDGYHPELRQVVQAAPEVIKWPVFIRPEMTSWSAGRLVLLGDSCHPIMPYMAAGAAMAIEDAAVLSRCLARFRDHAQAFAVYEATRMPRVNKVRTISLANTWLREPTDPDWLFTYDACEIPLVQ